MNRIAAAALLAAGCNSIEVVRASPPVAESAQEEKTPLSVERIFSDPDLTGTPGRRAMWLPDGSGYVVLERAPAAPDSKDQRPQVSVVRIDAASGARSLWIAPDAFAKAFAGGAGRQRPSGRPGLADFTILPDGKSLLTESGGDLWIYDVPSASARRLTATRDQVERMASPSPTGMRVAFIRDFDLWVVDAAGGEPRQLTRGGSEDRTHGLSDWVYDEELEVSTGYWWSPDGNRIAFLEMDESPVPKIPIVDFLPRHPQVEWERYPKAGDANPVVQLGIVDATGGSPRWIELPGAEYVARIDWTPRSDAVLVQTLNRAQDRLTLHSVDPATGAASVVFEETSPAWIDLHRDLRVLRDGRILWRSARTGFQHLFVYAPATRSWKQLTSGAWNVEGVEGIDEDAGTVWFSADEASPRERHLYRVRLDGTGLERLTTERGVHAVAMAPNARWFLDSWSSAAHPRQRDLRRADGSLVATVDVDRCEELDKFRRATTEFVEIPADDGVKLQAQWIKPARFDPSRRYPVLMEVYGGPLAAVVHDAWPSRGRLWDEMLADGGLLVLLVDNRAAAPHGIGSAGAIKGRLCEVELSDELQAVKWLRAQPFVDGQRIGIWGWSYGGTMASYSILNAPDAFRAAVAVAPVTDWRDYDTIYTERYMGLPKDNPKGYEKSSPVSAASNLRGKLMLVHGTSDDNVHVQNTMQLADALIRAGKPFRLMTYPGRRHGMGGLTEHRHLFTAMTEFLFDALDVR